MKDRIEEILKSNFPDDVDKTASEINSMFESHLEEVRKTYQERIGFLERQIKTNP